MRFPAILLSALALGAPAVAGDQAVPPAPETGQTVEALPNPENFFARLTERYRRLDAYEDTVSVVERVQRDGDRPHGVETRRACRIEGDRLRVDTPGAQVTGNLDGSVSESPAMSSLVLRYNLWQAPHLALHFLDEPLRDFRAGVTGGFEVAAAELVDGAKGPRIRVKLQAAESDEDGGRAVFLLWVDPDSMLIDRVEGSQRLPDGAQLHTTLEIAVVRADGA